MEAGMIIVLTILGICAGSLLLHHLFSRGKELTGPATVKAHRVSAPRWRYLVTFTLADGEDLELYTTLQDYQTLKDGTRGQLTWQANQFLGFEPDI